MPSNNQRAKPSSATQKTYLPVGLTPRQIVSAYNADQWEEFINEWVSGLEKQYKAVQRFSGPGDKGRDVVGFVEAADFSRPWDCYQCKHHERPLSPAQIWIELGKLIYFTFVKDFSAPRKYRFVAPRDVGPSLKDLLAKPKDIGAQLLKNWPEHCEKKITETKEIPLDAALTKYINEFDFSIVGYSPLLEIVEAHMKTPHWSKRFKSDIPPRPSALEPPAEVAVSEMIYVGKLIEAYGDAQKVKINSLAELAALTKYNNHFKNSRRWFFQAETLNRFSRDHYPVGAFDELKQQIFDGVVDTCEKDFTHGFERVCATTDRAADLVIGNSDLEPHTGVGDKKGICHHLANEDKLNWVKK